MSGREKWLLSLIEEDTLSKRPLESDAPCMQLSELKYLFPQTSLKAAVEKMKPARASTVPLRKNGSTNLHVYTHQQNNCSHTKASIRWVF